MQLYRAYGHGLILWASGRQAQVFKPRARLAEGLNRVLWFVYKEVRLFDVSTTLPHAASKFCSVLRSCDPSLIAEGTAQQPLHTQPSVTPLCASLIFLSPASAMQPFQLSTAMLPTATHRHNPIEPLLPHTALESGHQHVQEAKLGLAYLIYY